MASNYILGLDIGNQYVKYAQLEPLKNDQFRLVSIGMAPAPTKGIRSDAKIDLETLAVTIKKLLKDGGIKQKEVNIALPEALVYTRIVQVPPLSERELASAIKWEAEQYIPLPLEEVYMDFSIVGESKDKDGNKKLDILLVAGPTKLIDRYNTVLSMAGLTPVAMETEIISASRALFPANLAKPPTVMVVNIGAQSTDLSILRKGVISFTRSIPVGGMSFTKALIQDFNFSPQQADEYKKTYGMERDQLEGKVAAALTPLFHGIVSEIKRSMTYFQNKFADERVTTIILSGGTAKMPGLVTEMAGNVGIETQIGNPWARVVKDPKRFAKLEDEGAIFVVSIGLAMRSE